MNIMALIGLWLCIDGSVSVLVYHRQTPKEHIVRLIRYLLGMYLILVSVY
jgi:energy-converting hydrogenase Eha subunit C